MPTTDNTGNVLSVAEMVALLERHPDGQLAALWLTSVANGDETEVLAVERRPTSVQIAYRVRFAECGCGHCGDATVDVPLIPITDLTPEIVWDFTTGVHEDDGAEVVVAQEPSQERFDMMVQWLEMRRLAFAGRGQQGEGYDDA